MNGRKSRLVTLIVLVVVCSSLVIGCASKLDAPMEAPAAAWDEAAEEDVVLVEREMAAGSSPREPGMATSSLDDIERLIIRDASLDLVVTDVEAALGEIDSLVSEHDGYIVESSTYQYQEGLRADVSLRVPADDLDAILSQLRDMATEVRSESVSGQDVTEEYVDLKSRLRHLENVEEKLNEFLDDAEDTEAALAVYERLQQIQAEIEQVKGRIQYLEQAAAMSSVHLSLMPDALAQPIEVGGWHPEGTLRDAFERLIRILQFFVDALIVIALNVIPVVVVIAAPIVVLIIVIRALVRRRRSRRAEADMATSQQKEE